MSTKKMGDKKLTMIYEKSKKGIPTVKIHTPLPRQQQFVLSDEEIITLAQWALVIEKHYQKPMDIEWAKDGLTNELYIIQARPETVHQSKNKKLFIQYKLQEKGKVLASGNAVGSNRYGYHYSGLGSLIETSGWYYNQ
jgi:pyruvate,water dikinase